MGFSSQQYQRKVEERPWKINPIWRGIGCFLILIVPIMAWIAATMFMESGQTVIRSAEMNKPIVITRSQIQEIDQVINAINRYTISHNIVGGQIFFTVIFLVVGYGLLAFLYAVLYRLVGPPRYGPFDVPPSVMRR